MSSQKGRSHLIVGLGNPGGRYEGTRHNIGFDVADALAKRLGCSFRRSWRRKGRVAKGDVGGQPVVILKPSTYMNLSGIAVRRCKKVEKVEVSDILVVVDDINLPFGALRLRSEGSSGGQRGLKSIEWTLKTQSYPRLKVGIGDRREGDLKDYVLGEFTPEEKDQLPGIIERAVEGIIIWLQSGIQEAKKHGI